MKMVIIGAGASYDSIIPNENSPHLYRKIWRPPMGRDLFSFHKEFDEILIKYPGAESLRSEVQNSQDIEETFQKKYDYSLKKNGAEFLFQIINVQFYLQDLFFNISKEYNGFGISNYDLLITEANEYYKRTNNEVIFINFNYDTLLERSIERICKNNISGPSDYIKYGLKVIKPHGSCNWFRRVRLINEQNWASIKKKGYSNYFNELQYETLSQILSSSLEPHITIENKPLYDIESDTTRDLLLLPEIVIPLKTKDGFALPGLHVQYLEKSLESIDEILIIGWKANEEHFLKLLKEKIKSQSVKIMYVCGSDDSIKSRLNEINNVEFIKYNGDFLFNEIPLKPGTFSSFMQEYNRNSQIQFFSNN